MVHRNVILKRIIRGCKSVLVGGQVPPGAVVVNHCCLSAVENPRVIVQLWSSEGIIVVSISCGGTGFTGGRRRSGQEGWQHRRISGAVSF
jgi:hypothetical protein